MACCEAPGTLHVTLLFARDLKDADWIGKQDPYCRLRVGNQVYRSHTHHMGGRNPVWNQRFSFNLTVDNTLQLEVWDKDLIHDDLLGEATIRLVNIRKLRSEHIDVPLTRRSGRHRGVVSLDLYFEPSAGTHGVGGMHAHYAANPIGQPYAAPYVPQAHASSQSAYSALGTPASGPGYMPAAVATAATGYPPQGYPSQAAGYPPQPSAGYPPQQQQCNTGYNAAPPPGYPTASHQYTQAHPGYAGYTTSTHCVHAGRPPRHGFGTTAMAVLGGLTAGAILF